MDAAAGAGDATASPGAPAPLAPGAAGAGPTREVFGYLPYWELDNGTDAYLRYDLLTTIAFFGVGYGVDGALITDAPGYRAYMSDRATTIIEQAHAAGVRTVITFQSFDINRNAAFLSDPTAQTTFIEQALALMAERGADGANIDIEGLSGIYFDEYGAFVGAFARAAKARNPAAEISVATNANTSGAKMAAAALADGADRAFIMGYNYRSAGSALVGNIAPLVRADGGLSLTRTLELYAAESTPVDRLVLGLPYYGRTWPTVSDALHAARQTDAAAYGSASVFFPKNLPGAAEGATATYDAVEQSVVLLRYDDARRTWVQTYYDDPTSLKPKMQLAIDRGLAGVGIWALGYDRGQPGYWELLAELFRGPQVEAVTISPNPTRSAAVRVEVAVTPAGSPDAQPVTAVRLSNDREQWGGWTAMGAPVPWTILTAGADGPRTVWAQARDAAGRTSAYASGVTVLDRTGPVVSMLRLDWSPSVRLWVATYNARDLTKIAAHQVRYRVGTGVAAGAWKTISRTADQRTFRIRAPATARVTVQVRARDAAGNWGPWVTKAKP